MKRMFAVLAVAGGIALMGASTAMATTDPTPAPTSSAKGAAAGNVRGASLSNTSGDLGYGAANTALVLWAVVGAGALAAGGTSVVVVRRRANSGAAI